MILDCAFSGLLEELSDNKRCPTITGVLLQADPGKVIIDGPGPSLSLPSLLTYAVMTYAVMHPLTQTTYKPRSFVKFEFGFNMSANDKTIIAFDLYGTLLSTESIAKELSTHFGKDKATSLAASWRRYQLEYTWRLNSMSMVTRLHVVLWH